LLIIYITICIFIIKIYFYISNLILGYLSYYIKVINNFYLNITSNYINTLNFNNMIFDFFEDNMFVDNIYLDISAFICEDIEFDIFDYFFITTFCSYDDNQEIQSYIFFNFLYKLICFFLYIIIIVSLISFLNSRIYLNNFLLFFIKLLNESTNNIAKKNMIIRTITAFLTMVVSITYIYIYFNVTFKSHYFIYFCVLINLSVFAGMFFSFKTRFLIVLEGFHKN